MHKFDVRKAFPDFYAPPRGRFADLVVPRFSFVMADGAGDPNTAPAYWVAVEWLYAVSYAMKFAAKAEGSDYGVPPLEALWWADDPESFVRREREKWRWTAMILVPDFVPAGLFEAAVAKTAGKRGDRPDTLRLGQLDEGRVLQTLHIGSYDDEGPVLRQLHEEVMPALGVTFNGPHHEIYLNDPRRTEPTKLKTILRQPIRAGSRRSRGTERDDRTADSAEAGRGPG